MLFVNVIFSLLFGLFCHGLLFMIDVCLLGLVFYCFILVVCLLGFVLFGCGFMGCV